MAQRALRVVAGPRCGSSRPVVVEADETRFFAKLRGAAQGTAALAAEIIVAELAMRWPSRSRAASAASRGLNLGLRHLEGAREIRPHEVEAADEDFACRVLWLDGLVMNADRTQRNPNVVISAGQSWLVDHGAALPFQYNWKAVSEDSPRSAAYPIDTHLFARHAKRLPAWDERLAERLSRAVLEDAVAQVPEAPRPFLGL